MSTKDLDKSFLMSLSEECVHRRVCLRCGKMMLKMIRWNVLLFESNTWKNPLMMSKILIKIEVIFNMASNLKGFAGTCSILPLLFLHIPYFFVCVD